MDGHARVPGVVLGAYAAKQCPRVTHNRFAPSVPPAPPPDPVVQLLFDAGDVFEDDVRVVLQDLHPEARPIAGESWSAVVEATMAALRDGAPVVIGGRLPDADGRSGAPDLLVRAGSGYLPIDVKNHRTLGSQKKSSLL